MDTSPLLRFTPGRGLGYLVVIALLAAAPLVSGRAQDQEQDPVSMRLDRLEQGLNDVQRQLNAGAVPSSGDSGAPTPSGGTQALNTEVRLDSLESQMRDLTGQIEEVNHNVQMLSSRLDKLQADDEIRFHALEHPGEPPVAPSTPTEGAPPAPDGSAPPAGPASLAPDANPDNANLTPNASGVLAAPGAPEAVMPDNGGGSAPPDQAPTADQGAGGGPVTLPNGSPGDQYNYAFGLVRQGDYAAAETAFKQFLHQNPQDPLAGNAQYWLGETYFARNQYQQAAAIFAQGYFKYPKSEKTPNVLLSLGISLGQLHKKQQACLVFGKLERQYPGMPQGLRDRERAEKSQIGCGHAAD